MVGYNIQTAVDSEHHFIVEHEVTNVGHDREQLANMSQKARARWTLRRLQSPLIAATAGARRS